MDDYREQHQQLLDRFRAALKKGGADSWFDEDELLIIFDYAGDIGNNYLRTEALLWGARYFPDSKALLERRCVLYADVLDSSAVSSFTTDIADKGTLITDLLKYRAEGMPKDEASIALDQVMAQDGRMLEDEEMIQLVAFAFETDNSQWIYDNFDKLRSKTTYLPTLLFEVAALSFEANDFIHAIPLLEELVSESPYSVEYWDMLTKSYFGIDKIDEAIEALEMELAIDPQYLPALQIKAHKLALEGNVAEIEKMATLYPDDQEIAEALINAKFVSYPLPETREKTQEIVDDLCNYAEIFPLSDVFIDRLLVLAPKNAKHALRNIWTSLTSCTTVEDAARHWKEWADGLLVEGKLAGALAVLEFYFSTKSIDNPTTDQMRITLALLYFKAKKWKKCYDTISKHRSPAMAANIMIIIAEIMSLLRLHCLDDARAVALNTSVYSTPISISDTLDWCGVTHIAFSSLNSFINDVLILTDPLNRNSISPERFDPFFFWEEL